MFGSKFLFETDIQPLVWINNLKEPISKLHKWKIKLNEYDFDIKYTKGKENVIADGLNRIGTDLVHQEIVNLNEMFGEDIDYDHKNDFMTTEEVMKE